MLGAIAGDIIGSIYEHNAVKSRDFPLFDDRCVFTDDTVLTVAVARAILTGSPYLDAIRTLGRRHPNVGYGASFVRWLHSDDSAPYNSWGNGSAMRVSPIGFAFHSEAEVLRHARLSAAITHNHPEGVKGAEAVALAVLLARTGHAKAAIRERVVARFGYDLNRSLDSIRPSYNFDVSCQGSVPEAIIAFLESDCYEDAVRNAISLGGDSDTQACIAGGIAEAFYGGVPNPVRERVQATLTDDLWQITEAFCERYR